MSHRIFSNEEITNKIREGVLLCLRGAGYLPDVEEYERQVAAEKAENL